MSASWDLGCTLIASLDGYTLELDPPIVIRAVRLTKPKAP